MKIIIRKEVKRCLLMEKEVSRRWIGILRGTDEFALVTNKISDC